MKIRNDMRNSDESMFFYNEAITFFDSEDYEGAIKSIKKNMKNLENPDEIALAYNICGFIYDKFGDNFSAIDNFSRSITFESEIELLDQRSKDISLSGRSNSRYKIHDYQGAIEDKRNAKKIRLIENDSFSELNNFKIDYKNILLGTFLNIELEPKFSILIKASKVEKRKYDLIDDFKKVISKKRKDDVIRKLELLSESKYLAGDYKGSIKAVRRLEKYY